MQLFSDFILLKTVLTSLLNNSYFRIKYSPKKHSSLSPIYSIFGEAFESNPQVKQDLNGPTAGENQLEVAKTIQRGDERQLGWLYFDARNDEENWWKWMFFTIFWEEVEVLVLNREG